MEILYKYMSAERALTCLPEVGNSTLRATQPSALNDPFECAQTKTFIEKDRHMELMAEVLSGINETTPVSENEVRDARKRLGSLFWGELIRKQISQRFGIISFASEARDLLMWAHYTVDGSGFRNRIRDKWPERPYTG